MQLEWGCKTVRGMKVSSISSGCPATHALVLHQMPCDAFSPYTSPRGPSVVQLPSLIAGLQPADRERWDSLYAVEEHDGVCVIPPALVPKVVQWFSRTDDDDPHNAALERVEHQCPVGVCNLRTFEETRFSPLRVQRPLPAGVRPGTATEAAAAVERVYEETRGAGACDFCEMEKLTPPDVWGRVSGPRGTGCVSSSNVAKVGGDHGMVILRDHHPIAPLLDPATAVDVIADVLETAREWARCCVAHRMAARSAAGTAARADAAAGGRWFPALMWNVGLGSGASQPHGHAQVLVGEGRAPGRAELLRRAERDHRRVTGRAYLDDLLWCHQTVGLAVPVPPAAAGAEPTAFILALLTPIVTHEMCVLGRTLEDVARGLHVVARVLTQHFRSRCFNIASVMPPFDDPVVPGGQARTPTVRPPPRAFPPPAQEESPHERPWIMARVLDHTEKPSVTGNEHGSLQGTMEFYGPTVDDVDPYRTAALLQAVVTELGW